MKKYLFTLLLLPLSSTMAMEPETDLRQVVEMPAQMKGVFLEGMRSHMESLDLIIAALADNDLLEAASIAETSIGVGLGQKRQCDDSTDKQNQDNQTQHMGKQFGKFMPQGMKMMGMQLHIAADDFADVAREGNMGDAYKSLRNISSACVACHQSYQVK